MILWEEDENNSVGICALHIHRKLSVFQLFSNTSLSLFSARVVGSLWTEVENTFFNNV